MTLMHVPKFDLSKAEKGATADMVKATEMVAQIILGMDNRSALSVLLNVVAIVIGSSAKTETAAKANAMNFGREVCRGLEVNWPNRAKVEK